MAGMQEIEPVNTTELHGRAPRRMLLLATLGLALAFVLSPLAGPSGSARAQGVSKGMHGDWETRCDKPPGAQEEICSMMQFVTAEDRDNVGLSVIVLKTTPSTIKTSRRDPSLRHLGCPGALFQRARS